MVEGTLRQTGAVIHPLQVKPESLLCISCDRRSTITQALALSLGGGGGKGLSVALQIWAPGVPLCTDHAGVCFSLP